LGEMSGTQTVTLLQSEMPAHAHGARCDDGNGDQPAPPSNVWAIAGARRATVNQYAPAGGNNVQMSPFALSISGGNLPHNNMMPYLVLTFIIALQWVFPPRS